MVTPFVTNYSVVALHSNLDEYICKTIICQLLWVAKINMKHIYTKKTGIRDEYPSVDFTFS